jgi:hypothetical protein
MTSKQQNSRRSLPFRLKERGSPLTVNNQVGSELLVSVWPEPPSAIPAEPSAGAITERRHPNRTGVRSIAIERQWPMRSSAPLALNVLLLMQDDKLDAYADDKARN